MIISHSHRFIFIHVGKTGGMSVREVLLPFCAEPEKFKMRRPPKFKENQPNPMYAVWEALLLHAKARDVQKELTPEVFNPYFKFAFVRNPWDLQVSMYHFILREPTAPRHAEVKAAGSFEGFLEWVAVTPDPYPKGITKLQSDMVVDSGGNLLVDYIGRYETLSTDFAHVCQVVAIDAPLPHLNQSVHKDYRTYYNGHTRGLVGEIFKSDIERFDYAFEELRAAKAAG